MSTITATYQGNLRVNCAHTSSGAAVETSTRVGQYGADDSFSPTDLCVAALAACMSSAMGLYGEREGLDLKGMRLEVEKSMAEDMRRIDRVKITVHMPPGDYTDKQKTILERSAHSCPVSSSLHPDIAKEVVFVWP